jgi:prepilin-type N-terminal cleavage/methylation domain-containing protein
MQSVIDMLKKRARARRARQARDRGITLLEIMIVLALIALVTLALVKGIIPMFSGGKKDVAKLAVGKMATVIEIYKSHNDQKCPTTVDDLVADGLVAKGEIKDPWGQVYTIKDCAVVASNGPDKQEGTADDIKSGE